VAREAPSKPPTARLFVALELPASARERIVAWQGRAFGGHGRAVRLVAPPSLHVTLAFLGHHPEGALEAIRDAALSSLGGLRAPVLAPVGVVGVPPRRPRLWALDLADRDGRAAEVQAAVADPLAAGGWYRPEKRPFWPHVTVARLRARERPPRVAAEPPAGSFTASEVVLYRSRLSRAGADYEALARMRLR
jgi:RNA 2',3'-cyclic 3'-phosphodiesterase